MTDEKSAVGFTDFKGYRFTKDSVTHGYCVCMYVGSVCTIMLLFDRCFCLKQEDEIMQRTAIAVTLMHYKFLSLPPFPPPSLSLSLILVNGPSMLTLIGLGPGCIHSAIYYRRMLYSTSEWDLVSIIAVNFWQKPSIACWHGLAVRLDSITCFYIHFVRDSESKN